MTCTSRRVLLRSNPTCNMRTGPPSVPPAGSHRKRDPGGGPRLHGIQGPLRDASVGAGSPWLVRVREPDHLRVEPADPQLAFGLRLVELAEPHRCVAGDDDRTPAGPDDHDPRAGGVAGCREESEPGKEVELAVDRHVPPAGRL